MNRLSDEELLAELGVEQEQKKHRTYSAEEERVIAGFEDIVRFYDEHGRIPSHGEQNDIFERLYAVRLNRLCDNAHWREFLHPFDKHHLLDEAFHPPVETMDLDDDALLAELGIDAPSEDGIENLRHVRPHAEKTQPEEVASRKPVENFAEFKPLFEEVQKDLVDGVRQTRPFQRNAEIRKGDFFVLYGQLAYVAELGEPFVAEYGRPDRRSRVIFSNETESDLLLRSLQRALYKDETARRITEPEVGPLFTGEIESEDLASGTIYVLRSKSQYPVIVQNRELIHKIGVTGGSVENRIVGAKNDPTYLMDDVEIVATYKLFNINRVKLEKLLHKVFRNAQFDITIKDRFGKPIHPREWFLVPLSVIDEVVDKIKNGTLAEFEYDPQQGKLRFLGAQS